jgi:phosphatidylserine/phosphatidylglycerophosphate/cardiolipin synthase-like enzyme
MKRSGRGCGPPLALVSVLLVAGLFCRLATLARAFEETRTATTWQVFFSPDGGCTRAIVNAIAAANKQILVQAYEMTSPQIKSALVAARKRGVQVTAILDHSAVNQRNTMAGELSAGGVTVFIDSAHSPGLAHNKVMVIDQAMVITGSFNFTKAAETRNAENLLIVRDQALAAAYAKNFSNHLAHSSPLGAADIPAPKSSYHRRSYYPRYHHWHSYW